MLCNCKYLAYADQKKTVGGEFLLEIFMPIHTNWTEIPRGRWLAESLYRRSRILRRFSFSTVCYGADSIFTQSLRRNSVSAQFTPTQNQYLHSRLLCKFSLAHSSTAHIHYRRSRLLCWFSFIAAVVFCAVQKLLRILNLILGHFIKI
jgi:hypothetical protein